MHLKNNYHRDGSVTFFDVYAQRWVRTRRPCDADLAAMNEEERARVCRHCGIVYERAA